MAKFGNQPQVVIKIKHGIGLQMTMIKFGIKNQISTISTEMEF
jgi:hypothetical protein